MKNILARIAKLNERGKQIHYVAQYDEIALHYDAVFQGYQEQSLHPIYSVTKSLTAVTVLHLLEKYNLSTDTKLSDTLDLSAFSSQVQQLSVAQFLNMTTGIIWRERTSSGQASRDLNDFFEAEQPLEFLFAKPISRQKNHFTYNSAAIHSLTYWCAALTGQPFEDIVKSLIFTPLAITRYQWQRDGQGQVYGGHGLALSATDFVKLGMVFLAGHYRGKVIISENTMSKLRQCTSHNIYYHYDYGYTMWHGKIKGKRYHAAFGYGGQRLYNFYEEGVGFAFLGKTHPEFGLHENLLKRYF